MLVDKDQGEWTVFKRELKRYESTGYKFDESLFSESTIRAWKFKAQRDQIISEARAVFNSRIADAGGQAEVRVFHKESRAAARALEHRLRNSVANCSSADEIDE